MGEREKILLVDDDVDLVESLKIFLEGSGYQVVTAHDADSGIAQVESERPDLILLDIMMPSGTEGFTVIWRLRQREEAYFRNVPIIMVTAIHSRTGLRFYPESADGTYKEGEHVPVQDFIDKPVDPARLLERIQSVLTTAWRKA
jgi:CheY-like chemotaxis protein